MEGVVEGKRCENSNLGLKITILRERQYGFTQSYGDKYENKTTIAMTFCCVI